jgi:uncharacterized phage protein gp47/JayE
MATIKQFKDIVNSMLRFLSSKRPNVDTSPGTFTRDVVVDAVASELELLYNDLNRTSNAQSPDLAAVTDVERLGKNFQLRRKGPIKATGIITFYAFNSPSSTITVLQGTTLSSKATSTGASQQFVTTQDATLSSLNFNPDTGRYETDVPIRAVVPGTDSNVAPGTIAALLTPVSGVDGCYNFNAITNGADFEPLATFRQRLKTVLTGNNVGTSNGYYQAAAANSDVIDVKIASVGSGIEQLRRNDVGAVDIYIRGLISTQAPIETYIIPTITPYEFIPSKQPLDILASSGFSLTGSIHGVLVEGTDYNITQDSGKLAGSIRAADKFVFVSSKVSVGEEISITYSYNSLIESLQNYMDDDSRKVLGADLLVKAAIPRQIDISCTIRVLSGYNQSDIISAVGVALSAALDAYTIGEEVQQSDILAVIANTTGVDDVTVPLDIFEENSNTGTLTQDSSGNIEMPANSYATSGTITVTVRS